MKKKYLFGIVLMSAIAFSSCTEEIISGTDGQGTEQTDSSAQVIELRVMNGGDVVTRSGRPLYSSEAKQNIDNLKLWICDSNNKVVYVKDYTAWNSVSTEYTSGGHGREALLELAGTDKLPEGTYTVYALGYSDGSIYKINDFFTNSKIEKEETYKANGVLSLTSDGNVAEEIFAGSLSLSVETGKGFKTPLILNRQVAGTFAYVKDIPYIAGAKYLKLMASTRNNQLIYGNFANAELTGNGTGNTAKYVVNATQQGASISGAQEVVTIDLAAWFGTIQDNGKGLLATTSWTNPIGNGTNFASGSVFGGAFLFPFAKTSEQTLKLQLTNADGDALRTWNINLPADDGQLKAHEFVYFDSTTPWKQETVTDTKNVYSIVRNHMYAVGTRTSDNPSNPGTDPGTDEPESLNNKQELVLRVNDNWEVIHKMDIE